MAYTTIDDPSAHFQVKKWTGNASTNAITLDGNTDMQPDFMWHKEQNDTNGWHQFDSSRGVTKYFASNSSAVESTFSNYLSSFDSNGFTAAGGDSSMNSSSTAQCSWLWKSGAGSTSSNTDGGLTTTIQSNSTAGFNIGTYTGNGGYTTIGHGLGAIPDLVIIKGVDGNGQGGAAQYWVVGMPNTTTFGNGGSKTLFLDTDSAIATNTTIWYNTAFTTTTIPIGPHAAVNGNTAGYIFYAFKNIQGFSKVGEYTGAGSSSPFVYTGFKPAFVLIRRTDSANSWGIVDNKRGFNGDTKTVFADLTNAESSTYTLDLLSNGFRPNSNHSIFNQNSGNYVYIAFAENPFVSSTGIPTTAR